MSDDIGTSCIEITDQEWEQLELELYDEEIRMGRINPTTDQSIHNAEDGNENTFE